VDQSDQVNAAVLSPGATRQLLPYYQYAWVGVRLGHGTAGIPALQDRLAALASTVQKQVLLATHRRLPGLTFNIRSLAIIRGQVQQAILPQAVALAVFGGVAALAMLVLAGQGIAQLLSRSAADISALRALGATRAQAALATSLPCGIAIAGAVIIAVSGAIALSPLAPSRPGAAVRPGSRGTRGRPRARRRVGPAGRGPARPAGPDGGARDPPASRPRREPAVGNRAGGRRGRHAGGRGGG
jgi:hypothetical protein